MSKPLRDENTWSICSILALGLITGFVGLSCGLVRLIAEVLL